jgi:hypothetical protein
MVSDADRTGGVSRRTILMSEATYATYLGGRYELRDRLRNYAAELRDVGIRCTASWLYGTDDLPLPVGAPSVMTLGPEHDHLKRGWGERDADDVRRADSVVIFTDRLEESKRGGAHVEFGIALGLDKHIVVVGPRLNVFHHHPIVEQYETWDEGRAAVVAVAHGGHRRHLLRVM